MRQFFVILLMILICVGVSAQLEINIYTMTTKAHKNQIKIGGGFGSVPYEGIRGWNVELQYEYKMVENLSGFVSLGKNAGIYTSTGRSTGSSRTELWDNSWEYQISEKFNYADIGLRYQLFKIGERYKMKGTIGSSFAQSVFEFPEYIFINKGVIEEMNIVTRKAEVAMLLLGIENSVSINDRFGINLNINYRTTFNKKHELVRDVNFHNGTSTVKTGILHVVNVALQLGYFF